MPPTSGSHVSTDDHVSTDVELSIRFMDLTAVEEEPQAYITDLRRTQNKSGETRKSAIVS